MDHEYDPALLADERAAAIARRAAAQLDIESNGTAIPARAYWRLPGRNVLSWPQPVVEVVIRDDTPVEYIGRLKTDELEGFPFDRRMIRWWGDFLALRSDLLLKRLIDSIDDPQAEVALR